MMLDRHVPTLRARWARPAAKALGSRVVLWTCGKVATEGVGSPSGLRLSHMPTGRHHHRRRVGEPTRNHIELREEPSRLLANARPSRCPFIGCSHKCEEVARLGMSVY